MSAVVDLVLSKDTAACVTSLTVITAKMDINHEILRKQVMVGQFCNQVGCSQETATKILQAARWQIEVSGLGTGEEVGARTVNALWFCIYNTCSY